MDLEKHYDHDDGPPFDHPTFGRVQPSCHFPWILLRTTGGKEEPASFCNGCGEDDDMGLPWDTFAEEHPDCDPDGYVRRVLQAAVGRNTP